MIRTVLFSLCLCIAGCASQPPTPPVVPVLCQVPAGLLLRLPEPAKPQGDFTQRDVADYVVQLHRWGWVGWESLSAIDQWISNNCG